MKCSRCNGQNLVVERVLAFDTSNGRMVALIRCNKCFTNFQLVFWPSVGGMKDVEGHGSQTRTPGGGS